MIKIYLYTFSLIALFSCQNKPKKVDSDLQNIEQSTSIQKQKKEVKKIDLEKVDYKFYCGKTLGELLEHETLKNYEDYYFVDEPPFILALIIFRYLNTKKVVSVDIGSLTNQEKFNFDRNWSFDLLKKEKIEAIYVMENGWASKLLFTCDCEK